MSTIDLELDVFDSNGKPTGKTNTVTVDLASLSALVNTATRIALLSSSPETKATQMEYLRRQGLIDDGMKAGNGP
jgi:hypothetical protein